MRTIQFLFSFLIFFFPVIIKSEPSIVYAHSLNGNLIACTCTRVPIAGLSRRDSFLESKKIKSQETLFLELGNFFSSSDVPEKRKALLEGFQEIGNTYLFPGKQELQSLGISDWKEINRDRILLSNLKEKGLFKDGDLFTTKSILNLKGSKVLITSLLSEKSFQSLPTIFQSKYKWIAPKLSIPDILKDNTFDVLILGLIGNPQEFEDLASILPEKRVLFLVPFSSIKPTKGSIETKALGQIYSTSGKNGDEIGIIKLNAFKPSNIAIQTIVVDSFEDSPKILKIAEKWNLPSSP